MQLNKSSLITALLATVYGAPQGTAISNGVDGSVTNVRQTLDTLVAQFKHADGHPTEDMISSLITGLDSQIDNAAGTITAALSPLTGGLSEAVGGFLLGPFVQSVTNGAEVLISNVVGGSVDFVTQPAIRAVTQSISHVVQVARAHNVNANQLAHLNSQLITYSAHAKRENAILNGAEGAVTNSRQVIDTLVAQFQRADGHPTEDMISSLITGLDSQIDNAAGIITAALSPLTGGLSEAVGSFLLGPLVQSITNGAEVLISNVVGGSVDLVTQPAIKLLVSSVKNIVTMAKANNVDASKLSSAVTTLDHLSKAAKKNKRDSNGGPILAGVEDAVTNARQVIDTLVGQVKRNDGHPTADSISALITGLDSQIDNIAGTVTSALSPLSGGLSEAVGNFLLGPFVQSVTNGAEVLISNVAGSAVDLVTQPAIKLVTASIERLSKLAVQNNVDTRGLDAAGKKIAQIKAAPSGGKSHK